MAGQAQTNQAFPFRIKALEPAGQLVQAGQILELAGRSGPFKGLKFSVEQQVKTTWYPGNPTATQQAMGPVEKNTTINGVWRDRYLGDRAAQQLVDQAELLCRLAVPIEVSWGAGYVDGQVIGRPIVRTGLLKRFDHSYNESGSQDITWEMEFEWRGRGEDHASPVSVGPPVQQPDLQIIASQMEDAKDLFAQFADASRTQLFGLPPDLEASLEAKQTSLDNLNQGLTNMAVSVTGQPQLTAERLGLVVATLTQSVSIIMQGVDDMTKVPLHLLEVRDDGLDLLGLLATMLRTKRQLGQLAGEAAQARDAAAAANHTGVLVEVQAPAGVDLRDLALQYYGDPDQWYAIAHYNGLVGSRVPNNPDGPSDTRVTTIKIPQPGSVTTKVGDVC
jgi:hypothetical protein